MTSGSFSPPSVARAPAASAPTGAAPQTMPRHAPPTRPMRCSGVSLWRSEIATTEITATATPTSANAGPARTQLCDDAMIR